MDSMDNDGSAGQSEIGVLRSDVGELRGAVSRLSKEVVGIKMDIADLRENVATKSDIRRLTDAVESFAGRSLSDNAARVLHGQALTEVQVQMKDHELRIQGLEKRRAKPRG